MISASDASSIVADHTAAGAAVQAPVVIKLVTLNVNCDGQTLQRKALRFEKRFQHIKAFLKELDADIIMLNELREYPSQGTAYVTSVQQAFHEAYETCVFRHNCTPTSFYNVVLVRRRLGMVVEQKHLWPAPDGKGLSPVFSTVHDACDTDGRSVGVCVLELLITKASQSQAACSQPSGKRLAVAAFHASIARNDKRQQYVAVSHLPELYPTVPLILAGDFNIFAEDSLDDMFAALTTTMKEVVFDDMPGTFIPYSHEARYGVIMRLPPQRLDRIFVTRGIRPAATTEGQCCWTQPIYMNGGQCPDKCAAQLPPDADCWKRQFPVDGLASDHFALVAILEVGAAS